MQLNSRQTIFCWDDVTVSVFISPARTSIQIYLYGTLHSTHVFVDEATLRSDLLILSWLGAERINFIVAEVLHGKA